MIQLQNILQELALPVTHHESVHGGDINDAYCLYTNHSKYFLKVNDTALYPGMFAKEANGLNALRNNCAISIPAVIDHGNAGGQQYLLLEWIEKGNPGTDFWKDFGIALALMHQQPQAYFGWEEDNYIGSLHQLNTKYATWPLFYAECRILPLADKLFENGYFTRQDIESTEIFCTKLDGLFPAESAALLHGDLWSGNFMVTSNGNAAMYDPAVYFGHREMDNGMTRLFGGFDQQFYHAYNETYPLEKDWEKRLPLTQLYPLLVHAVLFGGHYVYEAREIIRRYL